MVYAPIHRASGIPIIITLITDDGGSEQLRLCCDFWFECSPDNYRIKKITLCDSVLES